MRVEVIGNNDAVRTAYIINQQNKHLIGAHVSVAALPIGFRRAFKIPGFYSVTQARTNVEGFGVKIRGVNDEIWNAKWDYRSGTVYICDTFFKMLHVSIPKPGKTVILRLKVKRLRD